MKLGPGQHRASHKPNLLIITLQNSPNFCVVKNAKGLERGWKRRVRLSRDAKKFVSCALYARDFDAAGASHLGKPNFAKRPNVLQSMPMSENNNFADMTHA